MLLGVIAPGWVSQGKLVLGGQTRLSIIPSTISRISSGSLVVEVVTGSAQTSHIPMDSYGPHRSGELCLAEPQLWEHGPSMRVQDQDQAADCAYATTWQFRAQGRVQR